jgi:GAF domain-containing protein
VTPSARDDDAGRGEDDQPAGQRRRAEDHLARVRVELAEQAAAVLPLSELPGAGRDLSRVEPLLRRVLDAVTELLGTDMAAVWVVDPAAQELYAVAWTGLEDDYIAPLRVPFGDGSAGRAVVDLAPVLVEDVDRWPSYDRYRDGAARHGIRSVFSIPMLTLAGEAVGALSAYHRAPSVSGDRELQLLETMASQAAEIVERARLHAEARALAGRERRRGEQLRMLAEAAGQLTAADDLETLLAVVTDAAVSIIGCHQGVATRLPHGWADATTYVALSETYDAWRGYDVVPQGLGVLEPVFRDNQVLRLTGEQMRAHPAWRGLRDAPGHPPLPDYLAAPFVGRDGSNLGLVQLSHKTDDSAFTAEDEAVVVQLSRMASSVLERLEALEGERAAREEAEAAAVVRGLLLDASAVFAASIEPGEVGARLLELAVPRLAEIAVLHLVDERDRPELEGVRCREPEHEAVARAWLSAPGSLDPDADYGVHAVLRAGREQLLPEVTEEMVRSIATDDASARQLRIIARRSGLVVPLLAAGRTLGALSLGRDEPYGPAEVDYAVDLARRAALSLDTAVRYAFERELATTLQTSLLPRQLPTSTLVSSAARYLAGARGTQVGGDWYDLLEVGGGQLVLVVGDVMGRGVQAAAVMGQLRAAVRAFALEGHGPADVLRLLERVVQTMDDLDFTTCVVGRLDP